MPQVIDKIRMNSGDFSGDSNSMLVAFEAGEKLSEEIVNIGGGIVGNALLKTDGDLHLAEQEAICADLDKIMADCIRRQRALNNKRRKWLDSEIDKLTP